MIIVFIGSSCGGKSFYFSLLKKYGFEMSISITARKQRKEKIFCLKNVKEQQFLDK